MFYLAAFVITEQQCLFSGMERVSLFCWLDDKLSMNPNLPSIEFSFVRGRWKWDHKLDSLANFHIRTRNVCYRWNINESKVTERMLEYYRTLISHNNRKDARTSHRSAHLNAAIINGGHWEWWDHIHIYLIALINQQLRQPSHCLIAINPTNRVVNFEPYEIYWGQNWNHLFKFKRIIQIPKSNCIEKWFCSLSACLEKMYWLWTKKFILCVSDFFFLFNFNYFGNA